MSNLIKVLLDHQSIMVNSGAIQKSTRKGEQQYIKSYLITIIALFDIMSSNLWSTNYRLDITFIALVLLYDWSKLWLIHIYFGYVVQWDLYEFGTVFWVLTFNLIFGCRLCRASQWLKHILDCCSFHLTHYFAHTSA